MEVLIEGQANAFPAPNLNTKSLWKITLRKLSLTKKTLILAQRFCLGVAEKKRKKSEGLVGKTCGFLFFKRVNRGACFGRVDNLHEVCPN
jgi:hypothetical protein